MFVPVAPQFVVDGAARHAQLVQLKSPPSARKVATLSQPGALSKLAESSCKAWHGQGGPIKQATANIANPRQHCLRPRGSLWQVNPARMKRMAPCNPLQPAPRPSDSPVLAHRPNEIVAAGRLKPALPPDQRAQCPLVDPSRANQESYWQTPKLSAQTTHDRVPSRLVFSSILPWMRRDNAINDSRI
jgi:hypothetical protein